MNRWIARRNRMLESRLGRLALRLASWAYGAGVLARRVGYALRLLPSRRLPVKTVCIGNLTTGGTGKTSAILLAAETFRRNGVHAAILSRGYRRPIQAKTVVALADGAEVSWTSAGDEPWMMHQTLKGTGTAIFVSPDRWRAGLEAIRTSKPQVLLMDDGYQHFRLRRDLDVALVNALDPFGGGHLIPLGNLREPLRGLRRAELVVVTHADQVPPERLQQIRKRLGDIHPGGEIVEAIHRPHFLLDLKTQARLPLETIHKKAVASFCAIGSPEPFEAHLRGLGARLAQTWRYPDHHPYAIEEMRSMDRIREGHGSMLVTTLKDAPRLPPGWRDAVAGEVLALAVRMEITQGQDIWESKLQKVKRHARK